MISQKTKRALTQSAWVREMFEQGLALKQKLGADQVFDFSLGNPLFEPPAAVVECWQKLLAQPPSGAHRYMPNAGFLETREYLAGKMQAEYSTPFSSDHIVLSVGAGGGLNSEL